LAQCVDANAVGAHQGDKPERRRQPRRTVACVTCHGADLKGLGPVPPLAGRSPSYTVRQLWDLQRGNRNGLWAPLMKAAVEKLTVDDLVAIAA
jgi:cytochrome c553